MSGVFFCKVGVKSNWVSSIILMTPNFSKQKNNPSQNRATLVFACAGGISPPWMYGTGRGRGIRPHQSPPVASGQLFAVPCKTHPHWRSRGLGGRFERLFYLRSVLTELTLPVRRDRWEPFCFTKFFYPRALGVGSRCVPLTC